MVGWPLRAIQIVGFLCIGAAMVLVVLGGHNTLALVLGVLGGPCSAVLALTARAKARPDK